MKFVDEAKIYVCAGKGGDGIVSFRREKYIPFGGPDGGDGGDGGSVYLQVCDNINTLADFRYTRHFKAQNGRPGEGANRTGADGEDKRIDVPRGTMVYDDDSGELLGDLTRSGQELLVAQGGFHGIGNTRYKSSSNRAPRQCKPGTLGEERNLRLELKVIADVGLLGMPNAGKSSLIRAVSQARPKVADYPFTTLHPQLGVVRVGALQSFVMADIPGLIAGASQGTGLGLRFLRHLARTRVLLHLIDLSPYSDSQNPAQDYFTLLEELHAYDRLLLNKPRWLVLNKMDLLGEDEREVRIADFLKEIDWHDPYFTISAQSGEGCHELCQQVMQELQHLQEDDAYKRTHSVD